MTTSTIMVVEDDPELREALSETLQLAGFTVLKAKDGMDALQKLTDASVNLIVSDIQMPNMDGQALLKKLKSAYPDIPVMLMTAYGTIQQAVDAMRFGAVDYLVKPFEAEVLVNMVSRYATTATQPNQDIIAADEKSHELFQVARRVAQSDATVMITGESGSGKEVLARFIHDHSARAEHAFIAINCAAIPENMLEATLFGYEKGAYTGAYKASPGKFEQAQGGTLLLDEITEMDLGLQAKLLRVLQEREVERLGGGKLIALDVRVIATSNRDVRAYVAEGSFREDLFYRLNVFPLQIPALRERSDDIIPLVERFLEKHCRLQKRTVPTLTEAAADKLIEHLWPGNVRELDNVVQRALILQAGDVLEQRDVHFEVAKVTTNVNVVMAETKSCVASEFTLKPDGADSLNDELKQREWNVIVTAIKAVNGSRKRAAERLGISQRTLRYKLARMREAGVNVPERFASETL